MTFADKVEVLAAEDEPKAENVRRVELKRGDKIESGPRKGKMRLHAIPWWQFRRAKKRVERKKQAASARRPNQGPAEASQEESSQEREASPARSQNFRESRKGKKGKGKGKGQRKGKSKMQQGKAENKGKNRKGKNWKGNQKHW